MNRRLLLIVLALSIATTVACVRQDEYDSLQQQVKQQDRQLQQIQPTQADSWAQVQAMRQELNQLRGQMDDLALAGGAKQIVEKLNRHDDALRQVGASLALDLQLDDTEAYAPIGSPEQTGFSPYAGQGVVGGGGNTVYPDAMQNDVYGSQANNTDSTMIIGQDGNVISSDTTQEQVVPVDLAKSLYDAGVSAYIARRYEEAQRSFSDYTKNYPSGRNIPDAWFYMGECYFQLNKFADAALAYDNIITKYPTSPRAPLAYLKQGIAFSKLGKVDAAKARIQDLIKKYPNTPEASRAKTFLKTNQ